MPRRSHIFGGPAQGFTTSHMPTGSSHYNYEKDGATIKFDTRRFEPAMNINQGDPSTHLDLMGRPIKYKKKSKTKLAKDGSGTPEPREPKRGRLRTLINKLTRNQ